MAIYVVEYENNKPIAQYSLPGVSAGLSFIEEQEGVWKDRTYRISDKSVIKNQSETKKWAKP